MRTGRRQPKKQVADPEWANDKVVVLVRDGYSCRKCGRPTRTVHHRRLKGMGGAMNDPTRNRPDRCVALCTVCHDWVHGDNNRKAAEAMGLIVPRTQPTETTPCLTLAGRLIFTVDGLALAA
jgi:5-methylcytosine-specific restriction endonuclease McrA